MCSSDQALALHEHDSLLFVPTVYVGILQQWTTLAIFALLTAFHQQRNLLEFLKKRETKHAKTECCDPLANVAEHMDAVAWVRGLPFRDHVVRLLAKLFVGEYFRHEENRAKHGDHARQNEANREQELRVDPKLGQLVREIGLDPTKQCTAAK